MPAGKSCTHTVAPTASANRDMSGIGYVNAGQYAGQRRLPSSAGSNQSNILTWCDIEVNAAKRTVATASPDREAPLTDGESRSRDLAGTLSVAMCQH